jgi:hypothetical protein
MGSRSLCCGKPESDSVFVSVTEDGTNNGIADGERGCGAARHARAIIRATIG